MKLIVVIVSWNTLELTRNCLNSLFPELRDIDGEVWIVDNHSSDGSVEMIKKEFPEVNLIENAENVGFARANNQILKKASGDLYLLLNTDTIIPQGSIRGLRAFMKNNPLAAAAGPKLKNADEIVEMPLKPLPTLMGEFRYCLSYHFFPFESLFRRILGYRQIDWRKITEPTEAEVLSAACLIIRDEVIKTIGVLAEDYFLFSEENDYFYRMRRAGFKGYYIPEIEVIHLIGRSRKKRGRLDTEVNFFRSRSLFFKKFYGRKAYVFKIIYNFFFAWSCLMEKLYILIKGRTNISGEVIYSELLRTLRKNG